MNIKMSKWGGGGEGWGNVYIYMTTILNWTSDERMRGRYCI